MARIDGRSGFDRPPGHSGAGTPDPIDGIDEPGFRLRNPGQEKPRVGHQAVVVEGRVKPVKAVR